ncbi:MAG: calcium/sodium antiporter [Ignavibacteria bacterium]|nr:calcium/sodium antiporter [Ignavibacteria bacterium]
MLINITLLIIGFLLLIKGADWLVNGASALAKRFNISDIIIGLTVVAFGTSAPELVVNAIASYSNHQDIVFGNVIGSNNFNLFVILGITGVIFPISVPVNTVRKDIPISFAAIIIMFILTNDFFFSGKEILSRYDGLILLAFFLLFLKYVYNQFKMHKAQEENLKKHHSSIQIILLILAGLAGLVFGGKFVVDSAIEIAQFFGISEKIIGLTIVAAGTSLPELATSVVAAIKKNNDIAVGNVIGSNIFNIFLILGISSLINPLNFNPVFNIDIALLSTGTILLFLFLFFSKSFQIKRWMAAVFLIIFISYTVSLIRTI